MRILQDIMAASSVETLCDEMFKFYVDVQIFHRSNDISVPHWRKGVNVTRSTG
jgi:hypothetical protein